MAIVYLDIGIFEVHNLNDYTMSHRLPITNHESNSKQAVTVKQVYDNNKFPPPQNQAYALIQL